VSLPRTFRNLVRHAGVLARSAPAAAERCFLRELAQLLRRSAGAYSKGGLPALAETIDLAPGNAPIPGRLDPALAQADTLAALLRAPPFRYCVRRAVLRYHVLRAAGRSPAFVIGAEHASNMPGLDGHAWVEVDGQPFREEDDRPRRMTVVYRHDAPPTRNPSP
jgi:hypothetical protein